ncbi:TPA: hypothetical protein ACKPXN_001755 [Pseudomonas aeruginosa]
MTESKICTCPSGEGSLRWPCPKHPAVEQAGGDEHVSLRGAANLAFNALHECVPAGGAEKQYSDAIRALETALRDIAYSVNRTATPQQFSDHLQREARAALTQPSPVRSSLLINGYQLRAALDFIAPDGTAEQLESEACIEWRQQDADFLEAGLYAFCAEYPEEGGVLLDEEPTTAQPSPLQSEKAEAERPEVVAYADPVAFATFKERGHEGGVAGREWMWAEPGAALVAMSRTDECERIVGELRADRDSWAEQAEQRLADWDEMRKERDAALARVAELETALEPFAAVADAYDDSEDDDHEPYTDMGCDDSLRLTLGQHRAGRIALEGRTPQAQAQHSVPEEFSFEYRHPNGESHTVTVSRDQVINEMPDFLFEALCSKFCNCEPAGETNVVECCCDEYAEEFKLLAAAPGNSAQHSVPGDIMRDAQRYRWLRDQQFYFSFSTENSDAGISSCTAGMSSRFKNLSWVDAAIDSAIAAAPGKEGV